MSHSPPPPYHLQSFHHTPVGARAHGAAISVDRRERGATDREHRKEHECVRVGRWWHWWRARMVEVSRAWRGCGPRPPTPVATARPSPSPRVIAPAVVKSAAIVKPRASALPRPLPPVSIPLASLTQLLHAYAAQVHARRWSVLPRILLDDPQFLRWLLVRVHQTRAYACVYRGDSEEAQMREAHDDDARCFVYAHRRTAPYTAATAKAIGACVGVVADFRLPSHCPDSVLRPRLAALLHCAPDALTYTVDRRSHRITCVHHAHDGIDIRVRVVRPNGEELATWTSVSIYRYARLMVVLQRFVDSMAREGLGGGVAHDTRGWKRGSVLYAMPWLHGTILQEHRADADTVTWASASLCPRDTLTVVVYNHTEWSQMQCVYTRWWDAVERRWTRAATRGHSTRVWGASVGQLGASGATRATLCATYGEWFVSGGEALPCARVGSRRTLGTRVAAAVACKCARARRSVKRLRRAARVAWAYATIAPTPVPSPLSPAARARRLRRQRLGRRAPAHHRLSGTSVRQTRPSFHSIHTIHSQPIAMTAFQHAVLVHTVRELAILWHLSHKHHAQTLHPWLHRHAERLAYQLWDDGAYAHEWSSRAVGAAVRQASSDPLTDPTDAALFLAMVLQLHGEPLWLTVRRGPHQAGFAHLQKTVGRQRPSDPALTGIYRHVQRKMNKSYTTRQP